MIRDTNTMDRPVERRTGVSRGMALGLAAAVLALGALALAAPAISRWSRSERTVDASRIRLARVTRGDLIRDISAQARVVAALSPTLVSPARGTVTLAVKAGSAVKKGDVLAVVESPELVSRLSQERATLESARADLARAEVTARQAQRRGQQSVDVAAVRLGAAQRALQRAGALADEGLLGRADLEKAQDDVTVAELELKNAREGLGLEAETLELEVGNRRQQVARQQALATELARQEDALRIRAPFDGKVSAVAVVDRAAVAENQQLLTVVDLSVFEVEFEVPEAYAADVTLGTAAEVLVEGRAWPARVATVSPEVRDSQVRGTLAFEGEAPAGLRQSQRVQARLSFERREGVLKVARGPFLEAGGGRLAYVVRDGVAERREIQAGAASLSEVEVASGLREGDEVVISDTSTFGGASTVLVR